MPQDVNKRVFLKSRPGVNGEPTDDNFDVEGCETPSSDKLQDGEALVKTLYLSVDPAFRCCLNEDTGAEYLTPLQIGDTVHWLGIGVVTASKDEGLKQGDYVTSNFDWPWTNVFVKAASQLKKLPKESVQDRPSLALSALGVTGLTAYLGIKVKGHVSPAANQTMVISAAAGSTGSLAGQIARAEGCKRVVGICGSKEKCEYLTSQLGFDAAVNYKTEDVSDRLKEACPDGVDVYFDNVGGDISDKVIQQMNRDSHVILCGQIAVYNKDVPYPPPIPAPTQQTLAERNITRDRFLVLNYADQFDEALLTLAGMMQQGKLQVRETVMEGIENAGKAFVSMMKGGNIGKQVVKVADV
ncbi:prostaglandin reductase 2-like isoform X2 [Haliotis rufescens]|uniref:prostaglandin reductase 2-like isoform X1 n=1 Tax=Haliotis rufescens TaxID=6454 RepID=UPI00201F4AE5|nr:prostaglandin reductase 2-like isoform X1 [Haliotis rufescens]XP_048259263.1 prostaglandin reductase 2-like isoform X2 [Haliotis rufescens]